jgi:hypothetical protein
MSRGLSITTVIAAGLLLGSCGGGGTSSEGGIGGTGISSGRVSQVGSVYVNGTHYNTDNAVFVIDGTTLDSLSGQAQISVGMVVRVTGTKNDATATGTASEVRYDSLLEGPVDSALLADGSLVIMGQTVWTNVDTVFKGDGATRLVIGDLAPGEQVEVSGFSDGATGILATRIEYIASATHYEVTGVATAVNNGTNQFQIGGLTIDASAVAASLPAEGTFVEVNSATAPLGGVLTADSIDILGNGDGTVGDPDDSIEVEGQIAKSLNDASLAANQFALDGQVVQVQAGTSYENGVQADLLVDRIVEVEGSMSGTILLADRIEFEISDDDKDTLGGNVTAVDTAAGTITLLGKTIHVTNSTILEYDEDSNSTFTLAELELAVDDIDPNNDFVESHIYIDNNSDLIATRIEWEDAPVGYDAELEGVIQNLNPTTHEFTIAGVVIDYTSWGGYTPQPNDRLEVEGNYEAMADKVIAIDIELH